MNRSTEWEFAIVEDPTCLQSPSRGEEPFNLAESGLTLSAPADLQSPTSGDEPLNGSVQPQTYTIEHLQSPTSGDEPFNLGRKMR